VQIDTVPKKEREEHSMDPSTPLAIGFIVSATGSFVGALAFVAAVALVGAFSYIFIPGDVHRIEFKIAT
jgi:hypothetical protein